MRRDTIWLMKPDHFDTWFEEECASPSMWAVPEESSSDDEPLVVVELDCDEVVEDSYDDEPPLD